MQINELAAQIGKTCTWRTRVMYCCIGTLGLLFPGWATVVAMRGVIRGFASSAPMNTWPAIVEELLKDD